MSTPTIRVRAAVAISGHDPANWIVAGSRLQSDDEIVDLMAQSLPGLSSLRWIEADIPLPAAIDAEVL